LTEKPIIGTIKLLNAFVSAFSFNIGTQRHNAVIADNVTNWPIIDLK